MPLEKTSSKLPLPRGGLQRLTGSSSNQVEASCTSAQQTVNLITHSQPLSWTGKTLNLSVDTCSCALTFLQRFFSVRSMLASDCYIICAACTLLATKSEDQTRAIKDIIKHSWRAR